MARTRPFGQWVPCQINQPKKTEDKKSLVGMCWSHGSSKVTWISKSTILNSQAIGIMYIHVQLVLVIKCKVHQWHGTTSAQQLNGRPKGLIHWMHLPHIVKCWGNYCTSSLSLSWARRFGIAPIIVIHWFPACGGLGCCNARVLHCLVFVVLWQHVAQHSCCQYGLSVGTDRQIVSWL